MLQNSMPLIKPFNRAFLLTLLGCFCLVTHAEEALKVGVCELNRLLSYQQQHVSAQVLAQQQVEVSSALAGRVQQVLVDYSGQAVKQGELLVQLEDTDLQLQAKQLAATLKGVQAQLNFALYQLKQARKLHAQKGVSEHILRQRQAEFASLQAERQSLQVQQQQIQHTLSKTRITAPFAGVILHKHVSLGAWVQAGQALFTLHNPTKVEIHAFLDKAQLHSLQQGQHIHLKDGEQSYPLSLLSLLPQLEPQRHLYQVILRSEATPPPTGLQAVLHWQSQTQTLPANYVVNRQQQLGVMYLGDNTVQFKPLSKALPGRRVSVGELAPDTFIVVSGQQGLAAGQRVNSEKACPAPFKQSEVLK